MTPLQLSAYTLTTCLGRGLETSREALRAERSGLAPCAFESVALDTWVGEVAGVDAQRLPEALARYDCRNNRLTLMGLETDGFAQRVREAVARYGADRVGVFLGTSTAGILQTELAYRRRDPVSGALPDDFHYRTTHNAFSLAEFTRDYFGLEGMAMAISTACSSSAKVFAAAARQLALGQIDAAIVGGVDTLCLTTLYGFASLQLTSSQPCRPYDAARDGISIGEGAAFALLERPDQPAPGTVLLLGVGESSDAYHMSAPHPQGLGARLAMEAALRSAGLGASDIDYINLHGTATPANDSAEGQAVSALFGDTVPGNSTKGYMGHTLGAAGAIEAIICAMALTDGRLPGSPGTGALDPAIPIRYQLHGADAPLRHALSNSFGFGGSNCSLVLGVTS
ncbi:beta-ketoacyl-[acyl-carrier-protein] synthase family protein [Hydrogenophaga sp.]|uniref:beta-ketoacyl-[acyl-carrier-protein] synthase family protein n=1 Tax=Hydrogenophaga sp. TaxID=1904254 RepID=UPI00272F44D1|nr:beta-ketoacyl-[acyl-carrier-protein] synthase family protein [Hydrogenophaga sp.]MDP2408571.1 beta-ketoacyl-[acyl-carrier-protein] synthase family protein [Hydrogenophaga sp.]MDP3884152.1 beta-ketoacyl-[acyl-carrier-protein] synthase family protein [Hydrogenophaga sp.]MDZ4175172.1 beta-ketoacyl-[acyl-carrier-protein] synthase family protein [Hydrogenophaga sp.]